MPKPDEMSRYEDMLDALMDEYPELEEEASALKSSMMEMEPSDEEPMEMEDDEYMEDEEMDLDDELDMEEEDEEAAPMPMF